MAGLTRRNFLRFIGASFAFAALGLLYVTLIEPFVLARVKRQALALPNWPEGLKLKVAVMADIHACEPWMSAARIRRLVDRCNELEADVVLLLGDYSAGLNLVTDYVHSKDWAPELARLKAPLGVHAILGNHDWWEDKTAQKNGHGPTFGRKALEANGVRVYENDVLRLEKEGRGFWVAGLGDQIALLPHSKYGRSSWQGVDDLDGTLAKVTTDEPVILMAHEPDVFPKVPDRVSLTLSGHTHGGQVRILGWSPVVPSRYGNRYAYGHVVEDGRHLLVSGGLGFSIAPVRFGVRPEINLIELG